MICTGKRMITGFCSEFSDAVAVQKYMLPSFPHPLFFYHLVFHNRTGYKILKSSRQSCNKLPLQFLFIWFHMFHSLSFFLKCLISLLFDIFTYRFIEALFLYFRVTWGTCTLIWTRERASILVVLILPLKGGAASLIQNTNYQYAINLLLLHFDLLFSKTVKTSFSDSGTFYKAVMIHNFGHSYFLWHSTVIVILHNLACYLVVQVVALVCNFAGSRNSATVRLNHWEVETLFHEFGHALHSLLSRTVFR